MTFAVTDAAERAAARDGRAARAADAAMREIGYWTAPWARGQGVMTAAARLVCRFGFDVLGLERIEWWAGRRQRRLAPGRGEARLHRGGHLPGPPAAPRRAAGRLGRRPARRGARLMATDLAPRSRPSCAATASCSRRGSRDDLPAIVELADDVARAWSASLRRHAHRRGRARAGSSERSRRRTGSTGRSATRPPGPSSAGRRCTGSRPSRPAPRSATACTPTTAGEASRVGRRGHRGRATPSATLGLLRVELVHDVGNVGSCAVATRSGFALEGVERQALGYPDGRVADLHRHARLATDPPGPADAAPPPLEVPELSGDGVRLRPGRADDAAAVLAGLSDPEAARWSPLPPPADLAAARGAGSPAGPPRAAGGASRVLGGRGGRRAWSGRSGCARSTWSTGGPRRRTGRCRRPAAGASPPRALDLATSYAVSRARPAPGAAAARPGEHRVLPGRREGRLRAGGHPARVRACWPTGFVDEHLHARVAGA